ncbi:MAG: hypothetical protein ACOYOS_19140 [Syntrophales bacterium]
MRDLSFVEEHPEHIVPEKGFQLFQLQGRRDTEHAAITIKTTVGHQNVAVGIDRFSHIERELAARGKTPSSSSPAEMNRIWEEAKKKI